MRGDTRRMEEVKWKMVEEARGQKIRKMGGVYALKWNFINA